jgi:translation initiation factor 4G
MDQYFNQMEKIIKEKKTSSRIRFMLQDVLDLRQVCVLFPISFATLVSDTTLAGPRQPQNNFLSTLFPKSNWVPRRGDQGPKTIDQIHKEAEMEEHREHIKVQQLMAKGSDKRRGGPPGPPISECEARAEEAEELLEDIIPFPLMTSVSATCLGH